VLRLPRRDVLAALAVTAGGCVPRAAREDDEGAPTVSERMPAIFLPHGGGPWPFVDVGFGDPEEHARLRRYLERLPSFAPFRPRAVLAISAHWEAPVPTVASAPRPPMLYDYHGFPPESYAITWPAPGDPALAAEVRALLEGAGLESAEDPARGFDHGTFVPLKLAFPAADVPTVQLSLVAGLDPSRHLAIGRALRPLRDAGVLIVGSGMSYHNLRGFFSGAAAAQRAAREFDAWLQEAVQRPEPQRDEALTGWASAPSARACHPREEHLLPLLVVAGAGGASAVSLPYTERLLGVQVSAVHFG
jgi:aromatic ring-opening dioxygenase catalytic subunit (LigB family)